MNCNHGLDNRFCAICNHSVFQRDQFNGRRIDEPEPRLKKGRDSSKWVGVGQSIKRDGENIMLTPAAVSESRFNSLNGRSEWAREQTLKSAAALVAAVGLQNIPRATLDEKPYAIKPTISGPVPNDLERVVWGGRIITVERLKPDYEVSSRPPKSTSPAVPTRFNFDRCSHARQKRNTRRPNWR